MVPIPFFLYVLLRRIPILGRSFSRADRVGQLEGVWIKVSPMALAEFGGVILTICIACYFGFKFYSGSDPTQQTSVANVEELSSSSEISILKSKLAEISNKKTEDVAAQIVILNRQISLSDQILELDPTSPTRGMVITERLNAEIEKEIVGLEAGVRVPHAPLDSNYLENGGGAFEMQSRLLSTIIVIKKYLQTESLTQRQQLVEQVNDEIREAAKLDIDDQFVASKLIRCLRAIHNQHGNAESHSFFQTVLSSYSKTDSLVVQTFIAGIKSQYENSQYSYVDVKGSLTVNREQVVEKLREQIQAALNSPDGVTPADLSLMVSRCEDLLAVGQPEAARLIHEKILSVETKEPNSNLDLRLERLGEKIKLFSQPFDSIGLVDIDNQAVSFKNDEAQFKLVFFTQTELEAKPIENLLRIVKAIEPALDDSSLEFAVVCVHTDENEAGVERRRKFVDESSRWHVWFLFEQTDEGREFLSGCPIDKTPYVVLLDKNLEVVALGSKPRIIQDLVFSKLN